MNEPITKEDILKGIPRRNRVDKMTIQEQAIHVAMYHVEEMPADPLLTDALILLQQAKDKVSDYVDYNQK